MKLNDRRGISRSGRLVLSSHRASYHTQWGEEWKGVKGPTKVDAQSRALKVRVRLYRVFSPNFLRNTLLTKARLAVATFASEIAEHKDGQKVKSSESS